MPHTFPATDSVTCLVGRTPWSAADAPGGWLTPCKVPISLFRQRDGGVPRGPGGPPHHFPSDPITLADFPSLNELSSSPSAAATAETDPREDVRRGPSGQRTQSSRRHPYSLGPPSGPRRDRHTMEIG